MTFLVYEMECCNVPVKATGILALSDMLVIKMSKMNEVSLRVFFPPRVGNEDFIIEWVMRQKNPAIRLFSS